MVHPSRLVVATSSGQRRRYEHVDEGDSVSGSDTDSDTETRNESNSENENDSKPRSIDKAKQNHSSLDNTIKIWSL